MVNDFTAEKADLVAVSMIVSPSAADRAGVKKVSKRGREGSRECLFVCLFVFSHIKCLLGRCADSCK